MPQGNSSGVCGLREYVTAPLAGSTRAEPGRDRGEHRSFAAMALVESVNNLRRLRSPFCVPVLADRFVADSFGDMTPSSLWIHYGSASIFRDRAARRLATVCRSLPEVQCSQRCTRNPKEKGKTTQCGSLVAAGACHFGSLTNCEFLEFLFELGASACGWRPCRRGLTRTGSATDMMP